MRGKKPNTADHERYEVRFPGLGRKDWVGNKLRVLSQKVGLCRADRKGQYIRGE
jgi:hypothetical protein